MLGEKCHCDCNERYLQDECRDLWVEVCLCLQTSWIKFRNHFLWCDNTSNLYRRIRWWWKYVKLQNSGKPSLARWGGPWKRIQQFRSHSYAQALTSVTSDAVITTYQMLQLCEDSDMDRRLLWRRWEQVATTSSELERIGERSCYQRAWNGFCILEWCLDRWSNHHTRHLLGVSPSVEIVVNESIVYGVGCSSSVALGDCWESGWLYEGFFTPLHRLL